MRNKAIIITLSILAILGCGGYFAYKYFKDKDKEKKKKEEEEQKKDKENKDTTHTTASTPNIQTSTQTNTTDYALDATDKIKNFQDWLDNVKKIKWVQATNAKLDNGKYLKKGSGYGNFGSSTQKAWNIYNNEYSKLQTSAENTTSTGLKPISTEEIKVFQDWMDTKGNWFGATNPDLTNGIKLNKSPNNYGRWTASTANAWKKYGNIYSEIRKTTKLVPYVAALKDSQTVSFSDAGYYNMLPIKKGETAGKYKKIKTVSGTDYYEYEDGEKLRYILKTDATLFKFLDI